jgi:hypothetical protein
MTYQVFSNNLMVYSRLFYLLPPQLHIRLSIPAGDIRPTINYGSEQNVA